MSAQGTAETVTKVKRYGVAKANLTAGWDSIHATAGQAHKAARALARKTKKAVRVCYWSYLPGKYSERDAAAYALKMLRA